MTTQLGLSGPKLQHILDESIEQTTVALWMLDSDGHVVYATHRSGFLPAAGTFDAGAEGQPEGTPTSLSRRIYHGETHVGTLIVRPMAETTTVDFLRLVLNLTARRIDEALAHTDELESLSREIVHCYDELHLLYEVGDMQGTTL